MESKKTYGLWLDDKRNPFEKDWKNWIFQYSPIPTTYEVVWVKSYDEFISWISKYGFPVVFFFDHDLADDVATEKVKKGMSKRQARKEKKKSKSGMDCAKWLVEYCLDNDLELPPYRIQSANPAGRDNIDGLLKSFNNRTK